jgi:hypothetical protein
MIEVIDNFLQEEEYQKVKGIISGQWFPYYLQHNVAYSDDRITKDIYDYFFTHMLYIKGDRSIPSPEAYNDIGHPIVTKIPNLGDLWRIKVNCYTNQETHYEHGRHTDGVPIKGKYKVALLNFTTCDGLTRFFPDGKDPIDIPSVENQLVIFDGDILHTSVTHTNTKIRLNININYVEKQ